MTSCGTITTLLGQMQAGDKDAANRLFDEVYVELKRMAGALIARRAFRGDPSERTELVSSAYVRLVGNRPLVAENRRHFFYLLSRAMQDVLVEQARSDLAAKRGGDRHRVPLTDFGVEMETRIVNVLDLNEALDLLQERDPDATEVVMLKFYGGRTLQEIAELKGCSLATVRRDWDYSRAWLHQRLSDFARTRRET